MKRMYFFMIVSFLLLSAVQDSFAAAEACVISQDAVMTDVALALEKKNLRNCFFEAVGKSNTAEVKRLLALGVSVNDMRDEYGETVLMRGAGGPGMKGSCHIDVLKIILEARADINIKNSWGFTALMAACGDASPGKVKLLLTAGADMDIQSAFGYTALTSASMYLHDRRPVWKQAHLAQVRMLILAGADVTLIDTSNGKSALQFAQERGFEKEFLKAIADRALYVSRCVEMCTALQECTPLPLELENLVKDYDEVDEEFVFLQERAQNLQRLERDLKK